MMERYEDIAARLDTPRDFIRWGASAFNRAKLHFEHGTSNAVDEALNLVLHALALDHDIPSWLLDGRLTEEEKRAVYALLQRRVQERKPYAYITNRARFAGLDFYVDERVLVPRSPIAELIEAQFEPWIEPERVNRILDLCTGSGCIAVACAYAFHDAAVDATDVSPGALEVARMNAEKLHVADRVLLHHADVFDGLPEAPYDIIVSNPPYVDAEDMATLPDEHRHEPKLGLAAGHDGLDIVRRILAGAPRYLAPHGILVVEVGNSRWALEQAYPELPFTWLEFQRGHAEVLLLRASQFASAGKPKPHKKTARVR
ncbi:MAG TPA: 50S ribosomal protein L3 N(5)-glutamine methyltransferase [Gammaproteobacteria bacterium]|nr:50S ribosomal protein L3 N(5)-glutamine methyltransferase [Gammaproteobacteria bacterium]